MTSSDTRVPGFLGRVLDADGTPVGTCFQVAPGVFVTAWHVLDGVGAGEPDDSVRLDPLAGGREPFEGRVTRVDPLHDLAVVQAQQALPVSIRGLAATDAVPLLNDIVITGVSGVVDPGHEFRHLDAIGTWAGGATRDDAVPLGRLESPAVVPGMSGAPVRRLTDDVVVGVISARYNSADGWLQHSVWVARTEYLEHLLAGVAPVTVSGVLRWDGAAELVLAVTDEGVRLTGPGVNVAAAHRGVGPGLASAVDEVRRARARLGGVRLVPEAVRRPPAAVTGGLRRAGELLASSFLSSDVARALTNVLRQAERQNVSVRVGVEARGEWARLPWEALPDPVSRRPLALHPLVTVYRRVEAEPVRSIPAPLRIVVAIASPEHGGGVLDYERELRNVLAAVRSARQGAAFVRIVPFATPAAIRAALKEPAHVLHLSGHGGPGQLSLEDQLGAVRTVTADEFVDEAIPPGSMPPMIALAACYTDVAAAPDTSSFAARLIERGASVVLGTETSVTDLYATRAFARIYESLTEAPVPDVVGAVAEARRTVQSHSPSRRSSGSRSWPDSTSGRCSPCSPAPGRCPSSTPRAPQRAPPTNRSTTMARRPARSCSPPWGGV